MRLTRKGFRAWLEAKPPLEIVGIRGEPYDCPLARYLAQKGLRQSELLLRAVYGPGGKFQNLPRWATQFIVQVDLQPGVNLVTAKQALKHLKG